MSIIDRFLTSFRGTDDGKPGLFQKSDASVWYRKPDGSEGEVGNGGSLPANDPSVGANWTFDPTTGALTIGSTVVDLSLLVIDSADETYEFTDDGIVVTGKDGASGAITLWDTGNSHFAQIDAAVGIKLRPSAVDGKGIEIRDEGNIPVFRVDPDGTVHIKTGTTIHADL